VKRLTGDVSLAQQNSALVVAICSEVKEFYPNCDARLPAAWPEIAGLIYPRYLDGITVCGNLCSDGLAEIASKFVQHMIQTTQIYLPDIVAFLQGPAYCGAHTDNPTCKEDIALLMQFALPVVAQVFKDKETEICRDNDGFC